ncbi:MAG TPA: hypothetical protein VFA15_06365 [Nitrososphaera sp.]|nr:hypothetical protein [Nitrososphaera sp.]
MDSSGYVLVSAAVPSPEEVPANAGQVMAQGMMVFGGGAMVAMPGFGRLGSRHGKSQKKSNGARKYSFALPNACPALL